MKIIKLSLVFLFSLGALLVVISYLNQNQIRCSERYGEYIVKGKMCYYTDIPDNILYTDSKEKIPDEYMLSNEDKDKYLTGGYPRLCKNTNKPPKVYQIFGSPLLNEDVTGTGYFRSIAICEGIYFIDEYSGAIGPSIFGPFNFNN